MSSIFKQASVNGTNGIVFDGRIFSHKITGIPMENIDVPPPSIISIRYSLFPLPSSARCIFGLPNVCDDRRKKDFLSNSTAGLSLGFIVFQAIDTGELRGRSTASQLNNSLAIPVVPK
jgi:hypothetical protein